MNNTIQKERFLQYSLQNKCESKYKKTYNIYKWIGAGNTKYHS